MQSSANAAIATKEWVHIPTPGDHYSPRTGSAVITVIRQMTRWHIEAGGRSRVLVAPETWDGYEDGARVEVPFSRLGTPSRWEKAIDSTLGAVVGRRLFSGRAYRRAAEHLGAQFDGVVFVHNEPSAVEEVARKCPHARVCLWVHNELFRTYTRRQTIRTLSHAHRVICCSAYIAKGVRIKSGECERIRVVLNGVDTQAFYPSKTRVCCQNPVILFVGRMVPQKGPDLLLMAAKELKRRNVRFLLRLVGSMNFSAANALSRYEKTLRGLALDLKESVQFLPFQDRERIAAEYRSADVLCVPSNWDDPCPLTVGEGMASGLPVIASLRGGIQEISQDAALYFSPPNVQELAEHLERVLEDDSLRIGLAARARDLAVSQSWPSQHQVLLQAIEC